MPAKVKRSKPTRGFFDHMRGTARLQIGQNERLTNL